MSLINDALKRASHVRRETNELPPTRPAQLRPRTRPGGGVGMTVILICFVIAGAVTLGGWAYWNKKYQTPQSETPGYAAKTPPATNAQPSAAALAAAAAAKTNNNPIARAANTLRKVEANNNDGEKIAESMKAPAAAANPPPAAAPAPVTAAPVAVASKPVSSTPKPVVTAPTPTPATHAPAQAHTPASTAPTQPVAAAPAGPKLQAIFFRATNPSAIINGKTVREGDEIAGGFEVMEIKRQSVRIQKGADSRDLTLR